MSELFPPIHENQHFYLPVDDLHEIYVEECGEEEGIPVIFLHGGPGSGCEAYHRQLFNPEKYRIILFDQRGCGRSKPHAELRQNTTQDLIADMEKIRKYLGIEKWVIAGGSWGSTLALAYSEEHSECVLGMIIRGIYLCTQKEIHWFYQQGASQFFPDYWQDFVAPIPENERDDLLHAYHKRLTGDNEIARMQAAKAWSLWEARVATLRPHTRLLEHFSNPHTALSLATLEAHYFVNNGFLEEGQLLGNAGRLADIPCYIIHGRYDMICPVEQAYGLHQQLPLSELFIVQEAGHAASESGIRAALIEASNKMLGKVLS
ncbi:MAG TPA: prolyl aminopeptidase [Leucothrix mucor]|uniref:Proline iminopeptidase n=1 Tax=Leucothrix mucor TaxID=45248 RepID=A0A7V2WUG4_LEUMU|nr:prolyl aminopeptidase [Leucothrix mucor]